MGRGKVVVEVVVVFSLNVYTDGLEALILSKVVVVVKVLVVFCEGFGSLCFDSGGMIEEESAT